MAIAAGKGNWANAAARSKARKSKLLEETRLRQLLKSGPETIAASIGELDYRKEIDIYSARLSGADLVEAALAHNLEREVSEVMGYCQGNLRSIVAVFALRFSYSNAKAVLRAVNGGISAENLASSVLPDENELNVDWIEIARQSETLEDAAAAMRGTPWGSAISDMDSDARLQEYEDTLDRHYYREAITELRASGLGHSLLLGYLRNEIDHRNIVNLLRALRQGLPVEQRLDAMLDGGSALKGSLLKSAAEADSQDALVEALRRSNMDTTELEEKLQEANEHGGFDPVVSYLAEERRSDMRRMSHLNPLSAFPIIYYLESKVIEVQNLRLLVRGKAVGLPDDIIEAHMTF
ncbi:MAG: V-type ATPase subunit [Candidatus Thermoplasmatota archaeon]|nr:V-type ATPase subunit [Candidatus Thermoplasmatota archaeon]MEC9001301.1 V-type ATPase subunit [Candidatus Thermoplasmatota archaeon]MEE3315658.1 V-type ATPase subunit [Candidatus Thermoplasmatota archaeon]